MKFKGCVDHQDDINRSARYSLQGRTSVVPKLHCFQAPHNAVCCQPASDLYSLQAHCDFPLVLLAGNDKFVSLDELNDQRWICASPWAVLSDHVQCSQVVLHSGSPSVLKLNPS